MSGFLFYFFFYKCIIYAQSLHSPIFLYYFSTAIFFCLLLLMHHVGPECLCAVYCVHGYVDNNALLNHLNLEWPVRRKPSHNAYGISDPTVSVKILFNRVGGEKTICTYSSVQQYSGKPVFLL